MFTEQELNQIRQVVREELKGANKPPVKIDPLTPLEWVKPQHKRDEEKRNLQYKALSTESIERNLKEFLAKYPEQDELHQYD